MSPAWAYWNHRVRELLGLPIEGKFEQQKLPQPWFLVPDAAELDDEEAADLYATVRHRLVGTGSSPIMSEILSRIRNITAEETLPLLYAMRHVARTKGGLAYYWPAFHERVIGADVTLEYTRQRLAPELSKVWLRLYTASRGALYFPREGKANIKWPLVHAGLLPRDEEALLKFGAELVRRHGVDPALAPLDPDEIDQFHVTLEGWLFGQTEYAHSRLALRVRSDDASSIAVAEVAQRWLGSKWELIAAGQAVPGAQRPALPRGQLVFEAARRRVVLKVHSGAWPGRVAATLRWMDQILDMLASYNPAADRTDFKELSMLLRSPTWEPVAALVVDGESHSFPVPRSVGASGKRGLVFRAGDGRATRQWQADEDYFVLVRVGPDVAAACNAIFQDWIRLGAPEGQWEDYEVLSGRTVDPLGLGRNKVAAPAVHDAIGRLEDATDKLGLPSFGHLWRPHISLVGGDRLSDIGEQTYADHDLPWIEVRGAWDDQLSLALTGQLGRLDTPDRRAMLALPPGVSYLLELAGASDGADQLVAGRYLLELDRTRDITFRVVSPPSPSSMGVWPRFVVALQIEVNGQPLDDERVVRGDLERGDVIATAWPFAQLRLRVRCDGWERILAIPADEHGQWRAHWRELALDAPAGSLQILANWRGLAKAQISVDDQPYVAEDNVTVDWVERHGCQFLELAAQVTSPGSHRRAFAIVLGARPWAGDIWQSPVDLARDGCFDTRLQVGHQEACWLIILPAGVPTSRRAARPWIVYSFSSRPTTPLTRYDLEGEEWSRWNSLVKRLEGAALPPELHDLLRVSQFGAWLAAHQDIVTLRSRWSTVDDLEALKRLATSIRSGARPRIIMVGRTVDREDLAPSAPLLEPRFPNYLADVIGDGGGDVPLALSRRDGTLEGLTSPLVLTLGGHRPTFQIHTLERFARCDKCGVILPYRLIDRHLPLYAGAESCVAMGPMLTSPDIGKPIPAWLAVHYDPLNTLLGLLDTLGHAAAGAEVAPHLHSWVDQLDEAFNVAGTADAHTWLTELRSVAVDLWRLVQGARWQTARVAMAGEIVRQHGDALAVLFRWLRAELGDDHARAE